MDMESEKMDEMRSILDQKRTLGYYLKSTWYYEKPYEKVILIVGGVLALWKIFELIF